MLTQWCCDFAATPSRETSPVVEFGTKPASAPPETRRTTFLLPPTRSYSSLEKAPGNMAEQHSCVG